MTIHTICTNEKYVSTLQVCNYTQNKISFMESVQFEM